MEKTCTAGKATDNTLMHAHWMLNT